jgi:hypothetical protein
MLDPARSSQGGGELETPRVQIGLIGTSGSGASGIVWSSILASGRRMPSDRWFIAHIGGRQHSKSELLSYVNSSSPDQDDKGSSTDASAEFSPTVSQFAVFEDDFKSGIPSPRRADVIEIFDTTSVGKKGKETWTEPGWRAHAYDDAPHIVLCHPMDYENDGYQGRENTVEYEKIFARLLKRCGRNAKKNGLTPLRSLVVAFTKYELGFLGNPRQAWRQANSPWVAREHLVRELRRVDILRQGLLELTEAGRVRVLALPVSSFGFLPNGGPPNYDGWLESGLRPRRALMTRPDIYCRALAVMHGAPSYVSDKEVEVDWLLKHWQPFLTWRPFVACISNDEHELLFPLENLLDAARSRKAESA